MRILLRVLVTSLLLVSSFFVLAQNALDVQNYKYMHMVSADELNQRINYNFQATQPPMAPVRAIAEWEQMAAVLVRYPFGLPIHFIKTLSLKDTVITIVNNEYAEDSVRNQYQSAGVDMSRVKFFYTNTDSYWTRDYGPWFIIDGQKKVSVLNFNYNRPRENDNKVPQYIDDYLGVPYYAMNVVHTGGNFMTDGYGSSASTNIVYSESADLGISNAQVDERMLNYMGVDNHIVVNDPNNTYIDHIDCWGKFLDVDKILIRKVPTSHPQYNEVEDMASFWANKTSKWGNKYQVFRVENPDNQPYTNSLILNKRVFVPITGSSYDNAALAVYTAAMPGYEVIGVLNNTDTPWESTDALHCRTHEIADKHMINIVHYPLLGTQIDTNLYTITANIDALSGEELVADSVILHYRYGQNAWATTKMINTEGNNFTVNLVNPVQGTNISYYITALDNSGKRNSHPIIGAFDPHSFVSGYTSNPIEKISISCDTIVFDPNSTNPTIVYLTNKGNESVNILNSNFNSLSYCTVTPLNASLQNSFSIAAGDSVGFMVVPIVNRNNYSSSMRTERLDFSTTYCTYSTIIKTDKLLTDEQLYFSDNQITITSDTLITICIKNSGFLTSHLLNISNQFKAIEVELVNKNLTFPIDLPAGDSILLNVSPIVPEYSRAIYLLDTIKVNTAQKEYSVLIKTTDLFLNPPEIVEFSADQIDFKKNDEYPIILTVRSLGKKPTTFNSWNINNLKYFVVTPVGNVDIPFTLNYYDSVQFSVRPRLYSDGGQNGGRASYNETLKLETDKNTYKVKLRADKWFMTAINLDANVEVIAYPNPFTQFVSIKTPNLANANVSVYSAIGEQVARLTATADGIFTWNSANMPSGLYVLVVETDKIIIPVRLIKL